MQNQNMGYKITEHQEIMLMSDILPKSANTLPFSSMNVISYRKYKLKWNMRRYWLTSVTPLEPFISLKYKYDLGNHICQDEQFIFP